MRFILLIVIINILNVNCGLLNELLTPVTEKVQNNELLDEHGRKNEEAAKKGVLTNVVESLDTGAEKLVNLLSKGNKGDKDEKVTTKPGNELSTPVSTTEKPKSKEETEKDVKINTTAATTPNTNATIPEDKDVTKPDDNKGKINKENKESVTPASSTNGDATTVESHTNTPESNKTETKTAETAEVKKE